MEKTMEQKNEENRERMSVGELMVGTVFAVILVIVLKNMWGGLIAAGAIGGGVGMGLGMLVIRGVNPKEQCR